LIATLGIILLFGSGSARREAAELARDASDWIMMLILRATSGFAADVPHGILEEERQRRLRWR
jgi:hypothetical protein